MGVSERLEKMATELAHAILRKERVYVDPYYRGDGVRIAGHWRDIPKYSHFVRGNLLPREGGFALNALAGEEIAEFHMAENSPIQAMVVRRPELEDTNDLDLFSEEDLFTSPVEYPILEWDGDAWFETHRQRFSTPMDLVVGQRPTNGLVVNGGHVREEGIRALVDLHQNPLLGEIVEFHAMENAPIHANLITDVFAGESADYVWDGERWVEAKLRDPQRR